MFENANSSAGNSGPAGAGGSASSMKPPVPQASGNNPSMPAGGAANGVEDIFSQMDGGKPARPAALAPKGTLPPNSGLAAAADESLKKDMDVKKLIIAVIGLVGLILIFLGLWYSYNIFLPSRQEAKTQTPAGQETQPVTQNNGVESQGNATSTGDNSGANEALSPESLTGIDIVGEQSGLENLTGDNSGSETGGVASQTSGGATLDSDSDSLPDAQESQLGTDSSKMDSDGDGLFDGEEVNTYKTDPLNADTDGDGFQDGNEVRNGYNPKGAGKLYEVKPQ